MLKDVVAVEPHANFRLATRFDDGAEGVVDAAQMISFTGVFEPLRDEAFFAQVTVHPELGTVRTQVRPELPAYRPLCVKRRVFPSGSST